MLHFEELGLLIGTIALGAVHGVEPGHGWPVAASYALDQANKWVYGFAASFILGLGHLISSIAMVGAFFYITLFSISRNINFTGGSLTSQRWMKSLLKSSNHHENGALSVSVSPASARR